MAAERYKNAGEQDKSQALLDRVDLRLSNTPNRYPYFKYKGLVRMGFKLVKPEPKVEAKQVEKPKHVKSGKPKKASGRQESRSDS